jgi:transposase
VELYAAVRRAVYVEGISEREASKRFGIARKTVHKMLGYSAPPGYQRKQPITRPKLEAFLGVIDQILEADKQQIRKQRHTSKRIFERLKQEHGYAGGYTVVKDYVREQSLRQKEMFVPLVHPPGHAQVDFGEADIVRNGQVERAHFFAMNLPQSDDAFVMAFPAETTEAFAEGHNQAFAYFGGVPQSIVYDNTKIAVAKILGDGTRRRTQAFTELISHYLFQERFGRPGKGNDKGKVEGLVGYARRNFFVPAPRCSSYEELNERLQTECRLRRERKLRGHSETIGERFERDRAVMLPLPPVPYEACAKVTTRVTSLSLVRFDRNDYSVPTAYGHRQVLIKGFVDRVVISCSAEEIARHARSYEREDMIFEPRHYRALLEQKTNALDQAAPLVGWELPEEITRLHRLLEARQGKRGKREYVQILRLLEIFPLDLVRRAAADAHQWQAISFDAVKHLLLCRLEQKPPQLDLENYPHLPTANVAMTLAQDYSSLLTEVA